MTRRGPSAERLGRIASRAVRAARLDRAGLCGDCGVVRLKSGEQCPIVEGPIWVGDKTTGRYRVRIQHATGETQYVDLKAVLGRGCGCGGAS